MPQQQQELTFKEKFNFAFSLCVYHSRGITVLCRNRWGRNALTFPCAGGLVLMILWFMFTADSFMLAWIFAWVVCQLKRRWESIKISGQVHSYYDGQSIDGRRWGMSEKTAKTVWEPLMCAILGGFLFWVYTEMEWRPTGLPYFLLTGIFTIPTVEWAKQAAWERRIEAMADARMDSEAAMRDYREKFGN